MEYYWNKIKEPDQIIMLDGDFTTIQRLRKRRNQQDQVNDIFENDLALQQQIYDSAHFVAKHERWDIVNCTENDTLKPMVEINKEIKKLVLHK